MKKEEVEPYLDKHVKIILKGSGNIYTGTILQINDDSFVIHDKFGQDVTVDYSMCGLITPQKNGGA